MVSLGYRLKEVCELKWITETHHKVGFSFTNRFKYFHLGLCYIPIVRNIKYSSSASEALAVQKFFYLIVSEIYHTGSRLKLPGQAISKHIG